MKKNQTNDDRLIDRYLAGELAGEELEAFEERLLYSPVLLDELEASERLRQGVQDVAAMERANAPAFRAVASAGSASVVSLFRSPRYAMAASVLLLISLGVSSYLLQQNLQTPGMDGGLPALTRIIPLVSVRAAAGSEPVNQLVLGDELQQYVLMLDPGFEDYTHYRASVLRLEPGESARLLWQVDNMIPGYEDMLALGVPATLLQTGDYEVRVDGWRNGGTPGRGYEVVNTLSFRVTEE